MTIKETYWLYTLRAGMCTSSKSNFVMTRPEQQLARATDQHHANMAYKTLQLKFNRIKHTLAQQCHKVSLHTILIGVMGTI